MFGALNRFISRLDSDPQEQWSGASGSYGFQVLRNTKADLALEPWFDFIVGINGRNIVRAAKSHQGALSGCIALTLQIWFEG